MIAAVLLTERLRLRHLAPTDRRLFCSLYGDPETMRFIAPALPRARALAGFAVALQATASGRGPWFFVAADRRRRRALGVCSIQRPRERQVEIGLMLSRAGRGRGFGHEIVARLVTAAFEALPIDTVWVQYRAANIAAQRLFAGLRFAMATGLRPRGVRRMDCIGSMRRSAWCALLKSTKGEHTMASMIGFIESVGRDAALRHATREQLLAHMRDAGVEPALRSAILDQDPAAIDSLIGPRTLYCANFIQMPGKEAPSKKPGKPAKKKPSKPTKKPGKPGKKPGKPAKKPAKPAKKTTRKPTKKARR